MANLLYSQFTINPTDTGYVVETDFFDDGTSQTRAVGVGDATGAPVNFASLVTKARNALSNNQTYLAIPSPTQAQSVAQVAALTRQVDGLIYYLLHELTGLSSIAGT